MNKTLAKLIFRAWPFAFGHDRLMTLLHPSPVNLSAMISKLRGFNIRIKYDPNTFLGRYIYFRGIYEEAIIKKMKRVIKPGMTVLDVGANIGLHSLVAASIVGPTGAVIAIEPYSGNRNLLNENIKMNGFDNIQVFGYALGKKNGKGRIYLTNKNNPGEATLRPKGKSTPELTEEITVRSLDSMLEDLKISKIDVVKIDTEGAELDILEGGEKFISCHPPKALFIECIDDHLIQFGKTSLALINWLKEKKYQVFGWRKGRWKKVEAIRGQNFDLVALGGSN